MHVCLPRSEDPVLKVARAIAAAGRWWHRAECDGIGFVPDGAALLVGNHGLYGLEVPIFFYLIHERIGRLPIGLADRRVFAWQPVRGLLARCGGHIGTVDTALALLGHRQLVVCYPGGSREVFKAPHQRYRLLWERSTGFARLAIRAGVPIVPFAARGVDDAYRNLGFLPGMRALFGRYAVPIAVGLGPVPWPVPFRFCIGQPISPPSHMSHAAHLKEQVITAVRALLVEAPTDARTNGDETNAVEAVAPTAAVVH